MPSKLSLQQSLCHRASLSRSATEEQQGQLGTKGETKAAQAGSKGSVVVIDTYVGQVPGQHVHIILEGPNCFSAGLGLGCN